MSFQVAYDNQNAYFRAQWKTRNPYPGEAHPFVRFDGKEWKPYGYPKLDEVVRKGEQPGIYEDRFSIMIDDGGVPEFANQGCWLTCHNGERDNPKFATRAEVQANPLYQALKQNDVRKYLPSTRTDAQASWDKGKTPEEIAKIKAAGGFLELMQWRAHRSNAVGMADDGYVLEYRLSDSGGNPFGSNVDPKTHQPRFMYDEKKVGKKALAAGDIRKVPTALVRGRERGSVRSQCRMDGRRPHPRVRPQQGRSEGVWRRQRERHGCLEGRHVDRGVGPPAQPRQPR